MGRVDSNSSEFASFLEEQLGLHAEAPGSGNWGELMQQRLSATRSPSFDTYRQRLASPAARREEVAQLARVVMVGETYFFRDSRQFEALTTVVLPELLLRRHEHDKVRVLSVACSTGEEPYSIAIAAREILGNRAERIEIHAFDVNPAAIAGAERALYSEWSLRATPISLRNRYFVRQGNLYGLPLEIRSAVTFEVRNLFEPDAEFFRPGHFDVILFRNALIYFSRPRIATALGRLTDTLAQDGVIFLGNAETPRSFEERLVPWEVCGSFCYRLGEGDDASRRLVDSRGAVAPLESETTQPQVEDAARPAHAGIETEAGDSAPELGSGAWVAAIEAATRRVTSLLTSKPSPSPMLKLEPGLDREVLLAEARELIAHERFGEALAKLDEIVAAGNRGGQVDLLRASILTNQGRFIESCDVCRRLLTEEPHSAGAYHLLGVANEQLGRFGEARKYHEIAITLEPNFAMSHWMLGRLCLRAGQRDEARRHLTDALELWRIEAAPSVAASSLYAGGFGRNAFVSLCRADLARCEVRP
jgi:chemotaxis protein methyltransferase CheR